MMITLYLGQGQLAGHRDGEGHLSVATSDVMPDALSADSDAPRGGAGGGGVGQG